MSKRRDIEEHVRTLGEIEGIMGAMKNLSLMESHKLNRVLATQYQVVNEIEAAGRDFLSFYPNHTPEFSHNDLYLVIGAERGFCKDFNDRLLSALDDHLKGTDDRDPVLIVVGRKLLQRAEQVHRIAAFVEGSTVAEEVPSVLIRVIDQLREIAARRKFGGKVSVAAVYHDSATETVVVRRLRPFQSLPLEAKAASSAPLLTLPPDKFFAELVDLYLFSVLHAISYSALMAESRARLAHLESALQRLERDQADLLRKRNVLRQEEITEEIEVLMLSDFVAPRRR